MDIFGKCAEYTDARDHMPIGLYPYFQTLDGSEGGTAGYQNREIIMCGSHNDLGLTTDPRVKTAARGALDESGQLLHRVTVSQREPVFARQLRV